MLLRYAIICKPNKNKSAKIQAFVNETCACQNDQIIYVPNIISQYRIVKYRV